MGVFHMILTDKQYRFCEFYMFGLPLDNMLSLSQALNYSNYTDTSFFSNNSYRALEYRKAENSLKYCFDNGTGAYYKAYGCKYDTAKANANRLLKDYNIRQELYYMSLFIKQTQLSRLEARDRYISPNTNIYDIKHNKKDRKLFISRWQLEDELKKLENK